jgi:hypothetical protein
MHRNLAIFNEKIIEFAKKKIQKFGLPILTF